MKKQIRNMEVESVYSSNTGITLVALVITIVVMLILAGVTINIAIGENGIISRTRGTNEKIRGEIVEKEVLIWKDESRLVRGAGGTEKTLDEFLGELLKEEFITEAERNEIKANSRIKIGEKDISFKID
jgi:hypothetical protein